MKSLFPLLTCIMLFALSCKKNKYEEMLPAPAPAPVADFRDSVTGYYSGTMRHIHTTFSGWDTIVDTVYASTLHIVPENSQWSNATTLNIGGVHMDATTAYAIQMNVYWGFGHPHDAASGNFTFSPGNTALYFNHSAGFATQCDIYIFQGNK